MQRHQSIKFRALLPSFFSPLIQRLDGGGGKEGGLFPSLCLPLGRCLDAPALSWAPFLFFSFHQLLVIAYRFCQNGEGKKEKEKGGFLDLSGLSRDRTF